MCPTETHTYPNGGRYESTRPGHTIAGLLYYRDPFQRETRVPLRRVVLAIKAFWLMHRGQVL